MDAAVRLPGSKSLTNRALLLASVADGPGLVRRALRSRDTELMAQALRALGHEVDSTGDDWRVVPASVADGARGDVGDRARVDCGLAGTVMRFVPPVAALTRARVAFDGDPHMRTRPIGTLLGALRDLGVEVDGGPFLPFTVAGRGAVRGGTVELDASASSQFVSALLLAGAAYEQGVDVVHRGEPVPSLPHLEMTVAMLRDAGVAVRAPSDDDGEADRWTVTPGPVTAREVLIEPDLSNAAPFLALAAVSGGTVLVRDWPRATTQPGDALRGLLTQMGCTCRLTEEGLVVTGPGRLEGLDVDLRDVGELTPVLAALAAVAETPSVLRGVAHIRGHETDRITALATELGRLGADVTERPDGLEIRPARLHGALFRTYADHRMAHAAAVVGAVVPGVEIEDVDTTAKTFPGFAGVWAGLL